MPLRERGFVMADASFRTSSSYACFSRIRPVSLNVPHTRYGNGNFAMDDTSLLYKTMRRLMFAGGAASSSCSFPLVPATQFTIPEQILENNRETYRDRLRYSTVSTLLPSDKFWNTLAASTIFIKQANSCMVSKSGASPWDDLDGYRLNKGHLPRKIRIKTDNQGIEEYFDVAISITSNADKMSAPASNAVRKSSEFLHVKMGILASSKLSTESFFPEHETKMQYIPEDNRLLIFESLDDESCPHTFHFNVSKVASQPEVQLYDKTSEREQTFYLEEPTGYGRLQLELENEDKFAKSFFKGSGNAPSTGLKYPNLELLADAKKRILAIVYAADADASNSQDIRVEANLNGRIVKVFAERGARVNKGDPLVVLEAMKMESVIGSPTSGVVSQVFSSAGETVNVGKPLIGITPDSEL